ncbi:MAG TPA: 2Fe-2S iron-sulfur cluster-binding protein [Thermoanaerobaculaceae bacterium]|nr:2Fe-2S iron-sulfur cluster-binding protein [Thermoanaerobaculaceae bacterium]
MSDKLTLTIDDVEIEGRPGQTILEAADEAGIYIPRLCHLKGLEPFGSCRVCTVLVNGRPQSACTQPISQGMVVESSTDKVKEIRKDIIDMLFVEGNHYCMFCEKSGNCELQAMAYRFGIAAPRYPYQFPKREVDGSHPDIMIDHNRCIRCARCVRSSRDLDGKEVFGFVNRGPHKELAVNAAARLVDTTADVTDQAMDACPVGALLKKRTGYAVPIGQRKFDHKPIGSQIEDAGSK